MTQITIKAKSRTDWLRACSLQLVGCKCATLTAQRLQMALSTERSRSPESTCVQGEHASHLHFARTSSHLPWQGRMQPRRKYLRISDNCSATRSTRCLLHCMKETHRMSTRLHSSIDPAGVAKEQDLAPKAKEKQAESSTNPSQCNVCPHNFDNSLSTLSTRCPLRCKRQFRMRHSRQHNSTRPWIPQDWLAKSASMLELGRVE